MIPLSVPNLSGNEWKYVKQCLDTNWVSSAGSFVLEFEKKVSSYTKARYAVSCVNGTSGLFIALKLCGIQPDEEVIVPTLTFIAPINAVKYMGAEPVFMDCDDFMNIDPQKIKDFCEKECSFGKSGLVNKHSNREIKAILAVHVFGNPCDMEAIMRIAKRYNLKVIEDASESIGSRYSSGAYNDQYTGTIGDIGVYSFNGNKIITTGGGGVIVTNDAKIAQKARYLINQAKDDPIRYIHNEIGYNLRLINIQAALGLAQLEQLDRFIKIKKQNYKIYASSLKGIEGVNLLGVPEGAVPNYWFYSLIVEKNKYGIDNLMLLKAFEKKKIEARPIWYLNHLQKPYRKSQAYKIEKALWFWQRVLNLPCSTSLRKDNITKVVSVIREKSIKG